MTNNYGHFISTSLLKDSELSKNDSLHILECGANSFSYAASLDSSLNIQKITLVDKADISQNIFTRKSCDIVIFNNDVGVEELNCDAKSIDIAIDSHLLHCLMTREEQVHYVKNVYKCLNQMGPFFLSVMIKTRRFEEKYQSFMKGRSFIHPGGSRYLFDPLELESLFLENGFKIEYLVVNAGQAFYLNDKMPESIDMMRAIVRKLP